MSKTNGNAVKPGFRQPPAATKAQEQRKSILERTDALENAYKSMVEGINNVFARQTNRLQLLEEAMGAVIEAVGIEQVQAIIVSKKQRERDERDAALQTLLEKALAEGQVEVAETIAEDSLIVGVEKNLQAT